jgi:aldose 1-epimerase
MASTHPIPLLIKIGTFLGQDVLQCKIECPKSGVSLDVMNYGAVIRDWQIPMPDGNRRSVVLGFDQFEHYPKYSPFFGAIVGRVANRIGGSKFTLDGQEYLLPPNEGKNHLHGGPASFGKRVKR